MQASLAPVNEELEEDGAFDESAVDPNVEDSDDSDQFTMKDQREDRYGTYRSAMSGGPSVMSDKH